MSIDAHQLRVVDRATGKLLGTVATISAAGFVISLKHRVADGTVLELRIDLPEPAVDLPVDIGVSSLWSSRASVSNSYFAGFQIIDISGEAQRRLDSLLKRLKPANP